MAGMAVDGLVSGFNTTEMITQLMTLEAAPQTLLKSKVTKTETFVSALQSLNTKLSSLKDSATKAATATSWQAVTAASTSTSVTATAAGTTLASSLSFTVDQVASGQTSLSAPAADLGTFFDGAIPAKLTLVSGDGSAAKFTTVDLTGVTDFAGFASALNKAGAGVSATLVNIGDGTTRVQLAGRSTGTAAAFDLYAGDVTADTLGGSVALMGRTTAADGATGPGNTVVTAARNAVITLWKGVAGAEQAVTSATNTFSDVVAGVGFTVSKVESDPVTVTVARDDAALRKLGSDLVTNIATVLSEITSRTKSTTTKSSDGRDVITGGALSADSATRQAKQTVLSAASLPVGNVSPSAVGFVLAKDGTISFDEAKFSAAMAADPVGTQKIVTTIAERVETAAKGLSDPTSGSLSLKIQGQQSYVKNLSDQVDNWDTRLALRRTTLERTYSSLEVSLSNINAQASWLTSQLESLSASSN